MYNLQHLNIVVKTKADTNEARLLTDPSKKELYGLYVTSLQCNDGPTFGKYLTDYTNGSYQKVGNYYWQVLSTNESVDLDNQNLLIGQYQRSLNVLTCGELNKVI